MYSCDVEDCHIEQSTGMVHVHCRRTCRLHCTGSNARFLINNKITMNCSKGAMVDIYRLMSRCAEFMSNNS